MMSFEPVANTRLRQLNLTLTLIQPQISFAQTMQMLRLQLKINTQQMTCRI